MESVWHILSVKGVEKNYIVCLDRNLFQHNYIMYIHPPATSLSTPVQSNQLCHGFYFYEAYNFFSFC